MSVQISVIIPAYNAEKYIKKCLDSIVGQSVSNIEVIIIDDGSVDNTKSICNEYAAKYSFIKVLSKKNGGQSSARNLGIKNASGDYLMFVDSDDFLEDNIFLSLKSALSVMRPDVLIGNYNSFFLDDDKEEKVPNKWSFDLKCLNDVTGKAALYALVEKKTFDWYPWLMIVRRAYLLEKNLFFLEGYFFEDAIWCPQIVYHANKLVGFDIHFYNYVRNRAGATTSIVSEKMCTDKLNALVCIDSFMQENDFEEKLYNRMFGNVNGIFASLLADSWYLPCDKRKLLLDGAKKYKIIFRYSPKKYQNVLFWLWKIVGCKGVSLILYLRARWVRRKK